MLDLAGNAAASRESEGSSAQDGIVSIYSIQRQFTLQNPRSPWRPVADRDQAGQEWNANKGSGYKHVT